MAAPVLAARNLPGETIIKRILALLVLLTADTAYQYSLATSEQADYQFSDMFAAGL